MSLFDQLVVRALPVVPRWVVSRVAARYVAGAERVDAIATIERLNRSGAMATVDLLGEEVEQREAAERVCSEYLELLAQISAQGLDSNVSVKLTSIGLKFDETFCAANLARLVASAVRYDNFVRIDMEDHTCTDSTLRIFSAVYRDQLATSDRPRVGIVLQAMLRRTLADIDQLPEGANVRLCKGIYREPEAIAWQGYEEVRQSFVACLDRLLSRGIYVGIATHDSYLVEQAKQQLLRYRRGPTEYEFQMLLGVTPRLRKRLIGEGHRLRVYVPYGRDWYAYSMRRLRENPTVAKQVMRSFVRPG